jgi:hypothetical protein
MSDTMNADPKVSKKILDLSKMTAKIEGEGPFLFTIASAPRLSFAPNVTALLLSRACGCPIEVRDAKTGEVVSTIDTEALELRQQEAKLLREGAFGGGTGNTTARPLSTKMEAIFDALRKPEGLDRKTFADLNGSGQNLRKIADRLAARDPAFSVALDRSEEPPRFWIYTEVEGDPIVLKHQREWERVQAAQKAAHAPADGDTDTPTTEAPAAAGRVARGRGKVT